ncbi:hypothetical protein KIPB_016903, partial [Kipferlia bialata]
ASDPDYAPDLYEDIPSDIERDMPPEVGGEREREGMGMDVDMGGTPPPPPPPPTVSTRVAVSPPSLLSALTRHVMPHGRGSEEPLCLED